MRLYHVHVLRGDIRFLSSFLVSTVAGAVRLGSPDQWQHAGAEVVKRDLIGSLSDYSGESSEWVSA
jgi:hypothetical protein